MTPPDMQLIAALSSEDGSARLKAALAIGTRREPDMVDVLVSRCATEPDFFVRDMLTWALTRYPREITVPKLVEELGSEIAQARSQALHTLSKIKDAGAYPAITFSLLTDPDDEVARSAWRAAVILVPEGKKAELADTLVTQLGRGGREVQISLSRALVALGADAVEPLLRKAMAGGSQDVHAHASATERLLRDPNAGFEAAIQEAKRRYALGAQEDGSAEN